MTSDNSRRYEDARNELEKLQSAPEKDMDAIDRLIDELERLQLAIKGESGIKGNNPNE